MSHTSDRTGTSWIGGFSLNELSHYLKEVDNVLEPDESQQLLFSRWLERTAFQDEHVLAARLAAADLTIERFRSLFSEDCRVAVDHPGWADRLEAAYAVESDDFAIKLSQLQLHPFIRVFSSLLSFYVDKLRDVIKSILGRFTSLEIDEASVEDSLVKAVSYKIIWLSSKPLILELNCMRVKGNLFGATPSERFTDFIEQMSAKRRSYSLLQEYPVLARRLIVLLDNWLSFSTELLTSLGADSSEIASSFLGCINTKLRLVDIGSDLGDSHCRGRSVAVLTFEGGSKVVYKPRPVDIDVEFLNLLDRLHALSPDIELQAPKALAREGYGWTEFILDAECRSERELVGFYERQGNLLALLYALEATDFHAENLIASGDRPVLVDLEALFHPRLPPDEDGAVDERLPGYDVLENSVFRVGFLPQRIWANKDSHGIDLSGLGAAEGQMSPHKVPVFEDDLTDQMRIVSKQIALPGGKNRPKIHGKAVHLPSYLAPLMDGFKKMYELLMSNKGALLESGGMLDAFSACQIRVVVRATRVYGLLLGNSMHPDVSRDGLWHERAFHLLWKRAFQKSRYIPLISSELEDLWENDIPLFRTSVASTDLVDSRQRVFPGFLEQSALERVKKRIDSLSEEDLEKQLNFIHNSIVTLDISTNGSWWDRKYEVSPNSNPIDPEVLVGFAERIAQRLTATAIVSSERINWLGLQLIEEKFWVFKPLDSDLYSGIPGIALFYAYLAEISDDSSHKQTAKVLIKSCLAGLERSQKNGQELSSLGAFSGLGGIAYTLTHLAWLWKDRELADKAYEFLLHGVGLVNEERSVDVISGIAGWLLCLNSARNLSSISPVPRELDLVGMISRAATRICDLSIPMSRGIAWAPEGEAYKPLTGFSHGASGVAHALLEAAVHAGSHKFAEIARAALEYERSVYSPKAANWPDYRSLNRAEPVPSEPGYQVDWCHGAPGIGLVRAKWKDQLDSSAREEIENAARTTLLHGFGRNHCLCHGDLGNAELFLSQGTEAPNDVRETLASIRHMVASSMKSHGYLCGTPQYIETPGLMTGLAGIGFGLLRLALPDRIPALLLLDGPISGEL